MNIRKILLPLDILDTSMPSAAIHQAAGLARHFGSEILLLYVVKPFTYVGGAEHVHELIEDDVEREEKELAQCCAAELAGLNVRHIVLRGDPAREILRVVQEEKIGLIVMPTHAYGAIERFLLGSITAKVLQSSECPVWTGTHLEEMASKEFAVRKVLCAVDFTLRSHDTVRWAQQIAAEFKAELTLSHVTPGVEIYGPGGYHELPEMKEALVGAATKQMADLQRLLGTQAEVFIGSGDVPKVLSHAASEIKADLLVVGCRALSGRLGSHGYGIIRESHIPVLSV